MKHLLFIFVVLLLTSCENFSNGNRVGYITKFSESGRLFKSWEGQLNTSQTGMTSSAPFDFSIDNGNEPEGIIATLSSALENGNKIKVTYHRVKYKNWFGNRGDTDYFVTDVEILDKVPVPTPVQKDTLYLPGN